MIRTTGHYQPLGDLEYFIPDPLPPHNPPLLLNKELIKSYGETMLAIGQLDEMSQRLPNLNRFIRAYVMKEALLTSAIEGIHTTLVETLSQSMTELQPNKETLLVLNYTNAVDNALAMLRQEQLPISSRIILKAHRVLMEVHSSPGQYRQQTVRVGEFVPPPAPQVPNLMAALEKYINEDDSLPPLLKAGLAHVQFETIHPFLDGNGRIGRLLIVLMLVDSKVISEPILYPSLYFKSTQQEYYKRLDAVRTQGDYEGWLEYYLKAIKVSSIDAHRRARDIEKLERDIQEMLQHERQFLRIRAQAKRALSIFFEHPVINVGEFARQMGKTYNAATAMINRFVEIGLLEEITMQKRHKLYSFPPYLKLLEKSY